MWINDKKINLENIVKENGLITKYENVPNNKGLGDSTIWKCTFENAATFEIEFGLDEFNLICNNIKN